MHQKQIRYKILHIPSARYIYVKSWPKPDSDPTSTIQTSCGMCFELAVFEDIVHAVAYLYSNKSYHVNTEYGFIYLHPFRYATGGIPRPINLDEYEILEV